jgi:hypothetical protein
MAELSLTRIWNPNPGWYRGDFHAHTTFSDGRYPPQELARMAVARGLDFFAITEHNNIRSFTEFGEDPGLLVIPGLEVTLGVGHWNVFGMAGWQDWMAGICGERITTSLPAGRSPASLMAAIAEQGQFNSMNHPLLEPWAWLDGSTPLGLLDFLEVWNDPLWPDNAQANRAATDFWTACLNAGYRITAIGGSDFHFCPGDHPTCPGEWIGLPSTYVFAGRLSGAAVLQGLRRGRAYLTMGPQAAFQARAGRMTWEIGADLGQREGDIELSASLAPGRGHRRMQIVKSGRPLAEVLAADGPARLEARDRLDPQLPAWYRLEVFAEDGAMEVLTNPIFAGPRLSRPEKTFADLAPATFL